MSRRLEIYRVDQLTFLRVWDPTVPVRTSSSILTLLGVWYIYRSLDWIPDTAYGNGARYSNCHSRITGQ